MPHFIKGHIYPYKTGTDLSLIGFPLTQSQQRDNLEIGSCFANMNVLLIGQHSSEQGKMVNCIPFDKKWSLYILTITKRYILTQGKKKKSRYTNCMFQSLLYLKIPCVK